MLTKYGNLNLLFKKIIKIFIKEKKRLSQNLTTLMHFSHKNALQELNCIPFYCQGAAKTCQKQNTDHDPCALAWLRRQDPL
jgi:hypothetical protein